MIRIGLVGSASSHAATFPRLLNVDRIVGDRARVTAIWSSSGDVDRTQEVARQGEIPDIAGGLHQLVDRVDAGMIVDRHGDLHAGHALPFLLEGKPVFVDTPFAIDLADCRRMLTAAGQTRAAITSRSTMAVAPDALALRNGLPGRIRLGQFAGPADFRSEHGGPFFSAPHLIELAIELLGPHITWLQATRSGDTVAIHVTWESDAIASLGYVSDTTDHVHASLFGTGGRVSREITVDDRASMAIVESAVEMFETGHSPLSARRLLLPIVMVNAIVRSLDRDGAWVDVASWLDREIEALGE